MFVGVIGGVAAFGFMGLVIGPVLLAFIVALLQLRGKARGRPLISRSAAVPAAFRRRLIPYRMRPPWICPRSSTR